MRILIAISEDVVDERAAHAHHTHTHRSMAARDVDAADRILDRRRRAQISRRTGLNECVRPYEYFPGCSASFPAQTDARRLHLRFAVWPNTLVSCALFNTLHSQSYAGIGRHEGVSREKYFLYAFLGAAVWCKLRAVLGVIAELILFPLLDFVPGYLFQALRYDDLVLIFEVITFLWCIACSHGYAPHLSMCRTDFNYRPILRSAGSLQIMSYVDPPPSQEQINPQPPPSTRKSTKFSGMHPTPHYQDGTANVKNLLNVHCRYHSGLGFSCLTFDWNQIAYLGSP